MNKRNLQKTARQVALDVLVSIEEQTSYSNLALKSALSKYSLDPKDKALVTEIVYGTVQRLNTLDYRLQPLLKQPLDRLDGWVRNLLRLSVYQLDYLERVPNFAVLNEAVEIAKRRSPKVSGFVNGVLRNLLRSGPPKFPSREKDPIRHLSLVHSHPEWLVKNWVEQYGVSETASICKANNSRPSLSLRVNSLKTTREFLLQQLAELGVSARESELSPDGVVLDSGTDIAKVHAFQEGFCTVQDESSMLVARSLDPKPGMRILDACAAPGGKTTHMAELMKDQGEIIAADIHEHKAELIRNSAHRLGLNSIKAVSGDIREILPTLGKFDAILLDAPCSGFGVIRRKPDIKWRKVPEDIAAIREIQESLIRAVADALKPGGILVYSTCTIEEKENQDVIRMFLKERKDFRLIALAPFLPERVAATIVAPEGWAQVLPHHFGTDGFFICRLQKM